MPGPPAHVRGRKLLGRPDVRMKDVEVTLTIQVPEDATDQDVEDAVEALLWFPQRRTPSSRGNQPAIRGIRNGQSERREPLPPQ